MEFFRKAVFKNIPFKRFQKKSVPSRIVLYFLLREGVYSKRHVKTCRNTVLFPILERYRFRDRDRAVSGRVRFIYDHV